MEQNDSDGGEKVERGSREIERSRDVESCCGYERKRFSRLLRLLEQCDDRHVAELLAALEEGDLQNEQVADEVATELPDKFASSSSRSA